MGVSQRPAFRARVWLVNPYGTLPGEGWREYRNTKLGRALARAGYEVTWWIAHFEHRSKVARSLDTARIPIEPGFSARIVPSMKYSKHIGIRRIRFERTFARNFALLARGEARPDIIVLAEPALFTSASVRRVAAAFRTPIVLDVIDLWPEVFKVAVPPIARGVEGAIFAPLYRRRARLMREAAGFIAVAPSYLTLARRLAGQRRSNNRVTAPPSALVYWGLHLSTFDAERNAQLASGRAALEQRFLGRDKRPGEVIAVYAGTLGDAYDVTRILDAAACLRAQQVTFILAGAGPLAARIERRIAEEKLLNCAFVGPLAPDALAGALAIADIGLATYVADSPVASPIKMFDYLASGLAVVNSLRGDLADLIEQEQVGVNYDSESVSSLVAALGALANDPTRLARLQVNARELAATFDDAVQYARAVAVIDSVVEGSCMGRR